MVFPVAQKPFRECQFPYKSCYGVYRRCDSPAYPNVWRCCFSSHKHFICDLDVDVSQTCSLSMSILCSIEENNAVGVSAPGAVCDAPAICCFREFLIINHYTKSFKRQALCGTPDKLLKQDLPVSYLANLERDISAGTQNTRLLRENGF